VDFQEGELEAIAAFDGNDYEPALPASLRWRSWYGHSPIELQETIGYELPKAIKQSKNRHNPLTVQVNRLGAFLERLARWDERPLSELVHWVAERPFETPSDRRRLLHAFDEIQAKDLRPEFGEHRTRGPIAQVIASLAAPAPNDRIYDPCFGSGGLLTATLDYLQNKDEKGTARGATPSLAVFGVECNLEAFVIGLTRLALAGADLPHLELGNSLERMQPDNPQKEGFDVVVANPPWGDRVRDEILSHYPVRTNDTSGLFIQHALMNLRPGGRAVVVVPEGLLFRGGAEQRLRVMLTKDHCLEAVLGLPEGLFQPYTLIRSCILVVRRGGETKQVRMVDASAYFEPAKGRRAPSIQPTAIEDLVAEVRGTEETANGWNVAVESLAAIEWDLTPRRRISSSLMATLAALGKEIRVVPLSECCSIMPGLSIRSEQHIERMPEKDPVPFVRIRDIQRGEASKAMSWLTPEVAKTVEPGWKLKAGDVLLSRSGTIGKVGIVRNGAVGGISANGLYVLRPNLDVLDPHFLIAYLESSQCRAWLDDRARGTTVRHLSKSVIESLPVPLPSMKIQERVVQERRDHDVDVLEYLLQLTSEGDRDPIAKWLEKSLWEIPREPKDPLDLSRWTQLGDQIQSLLAKASFGESNKSHLTEWLSSLRDATSPLSGASDLPKGPALWSLLRESLLGLEKSKSALRWNLPSEEQARRWTEFLKSQWKTAEEALETDVRVILTPNTITLNVGEMESCELEVRNNGPLPLRQLNLTTVPNWGSAEFPYLAEQSVVTVPMNGPAPKSAGTFVVIVEWSALTLGGQQISGRREVAFDVVEKEAIKGQVRAELGGSPYVCGDPIRPDRNDVFFGREELIEQIRRQVSESGNVVLLEGNRRAGKSSILRHLEGKEAIPGWLGVYCSLQGAEGSKDGVGVPTIEIFREMANSIAKGLQSLGGETPLPNGSILAPGQKLGIAKACREGIGDEAPFSDFRDYAEVALDVLKKQGLGLLLMLDEFDKLQEGIDNGVTSPQVPENIRFLVQTYPTFSAILTGSRRLKRLREEYWSALFGLGTRFGVTSLSEEAARRLITEPVRGKLTYSGEAVRRAIALTAGQPFLLQCLCSRIFDMAAQLKTRSITLDIVEQAGKVLVVDNEHFASLWDYPRSDRRRFILALCHRESSGPDTFRLGVIKERLSDYGIEIDDETLITDLEVLRELELLELREGQAGEGYALAIPLMGTWIDHQQDFAALQRKAQIETEDRNG